MAYRPLEKLINLHDGYRRIVHHQGRQLLLLQEGGTPYLIDRHCPHAGQVLDNARLDGDVLICPKHSIEFSLHTGLPKDSVCGALTVHALIYEGNSVGVESKER